MFGAGGIELAALVLLVGVVLVLLYRVTQQSGSPLTSPPTSIAEILFILVVALGGLFAPQLMAVVLLAMIYQQLAVIARKT